MKTKKSALKPAPQHRPMHIEFIPAHGPDQKPARSCSKEFLFKGKDEIDDSYISTVVIAAPGLMRAAFSIHDGQNTVGYKFDVSTAGNSSQLLLNAAHPGLEKLDRAVDTITQQLRALQAAAHHSIEQRAKRLDQQKGQ